ncbi:MAG: hypothetical protein ACYC27_03025 [Armatimonadota bacterium]
MNKPDKWTESRVYSLLNKVFPGDKGAFALIPQLRNGTGYTRSSVRTADAVAISCWPSRGLWMAGIEIKVSLQDWRKELASPEKADSIQQFCKYWYVACPEGVIPHGEVPETWGIIECHATGAKIVKPAAANECKNPDICLVASILRNIASNMTANAIIKDRIKEEAEKLAASQNHALKHELDRTVGRITKFEENSGVNIDNWSVGSIAEAVKLVMEGKHRYIPGMMQDIRKTAQNIINAIDQEEASS